MFFHTVVLLFIVLLCVVVFVEKSVSIKCLEKLEVNHFVWHEIHNNPQGHIYGYSNNRVKFITKTIVNA